MKTRILQLSLSLVCAVSVNFVGWPGPHGGLQYLGQILWMSRNGRSVPFALAMAIPLGILSLASLLPTRIIRVIITVSAAACLAYPYLVLLTRIHPPVLPVVLLTSTPFFLTLGGTVWVSFRPKSRPAAGDQTLSCEK